MKRIIIAIILCVTSASDKLYSQSVFLEWQTCIGGSADDHGNFMKLVVGNQGLGIVGRTDSDDGNLACGFQGNTDAFYATMDTLGSNHYYRCFGGTGYDEFNSFIEYVPGFYYKYIIGRTSSNDGDVSGNHGSLDAWLVKTTFGGQIFWQKCLGGTGWEDGFSIISTSDGNLLMAGIASSDTIDGQATGWRGDFDGWLVKMDTSGNVLWQKYYGGSSSDYLYSVIESSDGNYVAAGFTRSTDGDISNPLGSSDYWLIKVDTSGNLLWEKSFGGSTLDEAYKVIETHDGNYIIHGYSYSSDHDAISTKASPGSSNILLVKVDSSGNKIWSTCVGDQAGTFSKSIFEEPNGNLRIGALVSSASGDALGCNIHGCCDAWMVSLDSTGNLLSQECFGSNGVDGGDNAVVASTKTGHYYFLGQAGTNSGDVTGSHGGNEEIWVGKFVDSTLFTGVIDHNPSKLVMVFPNPCRDQLIIDGLHFSDREEFLFVDLIGKSFQCSYTFKENQVIFDTSALTEGVYILSVITQYIKTNYLVVKII